jgi:hypothetical protein
VSGNEEEALSSRFNKRHEVRNGQSKEVVAEEHCAMSLKMRDNACGIHKNMLRIGASNGI